jgi:hypothetical protein
MQVGRVQRVNKSAVDAEKRMVVVCFFFGDFAVERSRIFPTLVKRFHLTTCVVVGTKVS